MKGWPKASNHESDLREIDLEQLKTHASQGFWNPGLFIVSLPSSSTLMEESPRQLRNLRISCFINLRFPMLAAVRQLRY